MKHALGTIFYVLGICLGVGMVFVPLGYFFIVKTIIQKRPVRRREILRLMPWLQWIFYLACALVVAGIMLRR